MSCFSCRFWPGLLSLPFFAALREACRCFSLREPEASVSFDEIEAAEETGLTQRRKERKERPETRGEPQRRGLETHLNSLRAGVAVVTVSRRIEELEKQTTPDEGTPSEP